MMTYIFEAKGPVSILGLLAAIKLERDSNRIYEGAAMKAIPNFTTGCVESSL